MSDNEKGEGKQMPSGRPQELPKEEPPEKNEETWWQKRLGSICITVVCLVFAIYLLQALFRREMLNQLADAEVARGLITLIIAVGVTAIAFILSLAVLVIRADTNGVKERFALGKEVLTVLVGVLGTIVGFYFGTATGAEAEAPDVARAQVRPLEALEGTEVQLTTFVSGGNSPYRYSITFDPETVEGVEDGLSEDGWIIESITTPQVDTDTEVGFTIEVTDAEGRSAEDTWEKGDGLVIKDTGTSPSQ